MIFAVSSVVFVISLVVFVIFYLTPTLSKGEGDETEREKTFLRVVFVVSYFTPTLTPVSRTGQDGEGDETEMVIFKIVFVISFFTFCLKMLKERKIELLHWV